MTQWRDAIAAAADRISGHARVTPAGTVTIGGAEVRIKFEQMQHTGSFKVRGAFNSLLSLPIPDAGVVAASGGNHGAAVAHAAASLGIPAHVFVPEMAGPSKIALIERTGATLHVVPGAYADALAAAQAHESETGAAQIHAYDAEATVAGQGTLMREWEAQGLDADTVLIGVGGGGLIGGALAWTGTTRKIVAVEPALSCCLHSALAAGEPVDVQVGGVAANSLGAKRVGQICFDLARDLGTTVTLVEDDAITSAQLWAWQELRQMLEPGGAAALAALLSGAYRPQPGEKVAVLLCGGNVAPDPITPGTAG
jgi:threonine dehydratase